MGKIPRDLYEDELVPLFEKAGPIWDLRLMMDPLSGQNRGYAFITFCGKDAAAEAVKLVSPCTQSSLHRTKGLVSRTQMKPRPGLKITFNRESPLNVFGFFVV